MNDLIVGISILLAMAAATLLTRFLPFLLFPAGKETPPYITYLGRTLPYATVGLLVVYCLKSVTVSSYPNGLPELTAVAATAALHFWKRNSLLSIGLGTVLYMILIQFIF